MHCLKCGTEIESTRTFCDRCLEEMKQYPVSRETSVVIPKRPDPVIERKGKKAAKPQKPEELLAAMRKRQRILLRICVVLSCICLILAALLIFLPRSNHPRPTIGQNYITNVTQPFP